MTPAQSEAARSRLEAFLNALLEASISVLDREERAAVGGGTGLDATPVPLFSRGPSRRTGLCASDPDGGWYVREGDHREREDDKGKPLRKICWALEATIATTARLPGAAARRPRPRHRPGHHPARRRPRRHRRPGPGLRGRPRPQARLAGLRPRLYPGAPRALPPSRPGAGLPARHGLPRRPAGIQANTGGALLVEGTWYCPALPGPLITATASLRDHAISRDLYGQQITARAAYQLKRKDGPDTDGYQRLSCPARGTRPGLMCPLRRASLSPRDGRPRSSSPRKNRRGSAARRRSPSHPIPAPATARTCPTAARPGTSATPPCATPSKASTATPRTPPTRPSPSQPAAGSAASPPSRSSPRCCSSPPTSARSAPGEA